jgi:hypothetical protein
MDEVNNQSGNLSLGAAEWKPASLSSSIDEKDGNSDLNAGTVNEFIPGQGWTASTAAESSIHAGEAHGGFESLLFFEFFSEYTLKLIVFHLLNLDEKDVRSRNVTIPPFRRVRPRRHQPWHFDLCIRSE